MTVTVERYSTGLASDWASVLKRARNGVFLFSRDFMEYHSDRFHDFSALIYLDNVPVSVFPASIDNSSYHVTSHGGLTFGGPVFVKNLRGSSALEAIDALLGSLKQWGAKSLTVKLLPDAFCSYPSSEAAYAFWRRGFQVVRRDLSSLLPLDDSLPVNKSKMQASRKGIKAGLTCAPVPAETFHSLLEGVLLAQHGAKPVHSCAELELLSSRFPDDILTSGAWLSGRLLAATMIFKYGHVWHTQYMASSDEGRNLGALDLVLETVIAMGRESGVKYLSFGSSTEDGGMILNEGLMWQKESYGARSVTHDFMAGSL